MFTFPRASNDGLLALAPGLRTAENVEAVRRGGIVPQGAVVEGQPHIVCRGIAALRVTATRNTCTDFIPTNRELHQRVRFVSRHVVYFSAPSHSQEYDREHTGIRNETSAHATLAAIAKSVFHRSCLYIEQP